MLSHFSMLQQNFRVCPLVAEKGQSQAKDLETKQLLTFTEQKQKNILAFVASVCVGFCAILKVVRRANSLSSQNCPTAMKPKAPGMLDTQEDYCLAKSQYDEFYNSDIKLPRKGDLKEKNLK